MLSGRRLDLLDPSPLDVELEDIAHGRFRPAAVKLRPGATIIVVLAAGGYPGEIRKGDPITLPASLPEGVDIVHGGTKRLPDGRVVTTAIAPFNQNQVDLNLFNFAMYNQTLMGTVFGSCSPRVQIPNLLRLYEAGMLEVDDLITQEYTIDQIQDGYDDLHAGTNIRGIVKFDI